MKNSPLWPAALALALAVSMFAPSAKADEKRQVDVPKLAAAPQIDGRVDEQEWLGAARLENFTQLEQNEGQPESERTVALVGYDAENLYFGITCYDSEPTGIVANTQSRDSDLTYEDSIEIVIDTWLDHRNGFVFEINPLGTQHDGTIRQEGENIKYDWDGVWQAVTQRGEKGWTAEIAIPFKTLRYPNKPSQTWGFNIGRFIARKREEAYWQPLKRAYGYWARYKISEYGELRGFDNLARPQSFQLKPHVLAGSVEPRGEGEDFEADGGFDLKIHLGSNLVADVTYNTDFAETEADAQQVNLTRFPLYFPEKREFFLEGNDLFYFGERPEPYKDSESILFYSRSIGQADGGDVSVPVLGGVKLTGRFGNLALSALSIRTEEESYFDRGGERRTAPETDWSVVRLKQTVLGKSSLGLIALQKKNRGSLDPDNEGQGFDFDFVINESLKVGGYVARTETEGIGADYAVGADIWYDSNQWRARAAYEDVGEDFDPQMGFFLRTGVKKVRTNLTRLFWPKSERIRQVFVVHYMDYVEDQLGELDYRLNNVELSILNTNSSGVAFKAYDLTERLELPFEIHPGIVLPASTYHYSWGFFGFQTDYSKNLGATGRVRIGELYDGDIVQIFGATVWRPMERLLLFFSYEDSRINLPQGNFRRGLTFIEADFGLAKNITGKAIYQSLSQDRSNLQVIVDWAYRPGSNIYFVYNDIGDLLDSEFRPASGFTIDSRKFLVKASYRFDF